MTLIKMRMYCMIENILRKGTIVSQSMSKGGCQALVHWSVEFLWAMSAILPAGRSCQVDRVV